MGKGTDRLVRALKLRADLHWKAFTERHGQQIIDLLDLPIKIVLAPFTLANDLAGSAQRGFGIPELASHLSFSAIFVVATLGTYDIALELGKKVLCQRNCRTCNGWQGLRCTMCKGTGKVHYQVKSYSSKSGERATAESVAEAIAENRAELVHLPSAIDLSVALPSKECPNCDGSGVMGCPDCKHKLQVRISADDIMEPPWKAYNVLRRMDYPYENIAHSMRDPKIAAFWLFTYPQILGGFAYDDDVKQKIWWAYKESMRYDQLRDEVAKHEPGWEHLQKELDLPLSATSWTEEELKDPKKLLEMTTLLNAQREMADKILDAQWEAKWRQEKLNGLLEEKIKPYKQRIDKGVLQQPIIIQSQQQGNKDKKRRKWWFF
ncbi:Heat shock protein DnaJ cysteine-rich domain-containing protein [Dioscorea alata]|uniref:Heat shock protein DnaJ cysteine-rich domain-containing protein n=2 Tax=Dioscorea alata TaxID=55571 RepID=A0ACB7UBM7_DIOAL|nr:Heat shock protein DnaJ cysteine-rich domain-containing protein [Dioscorea alata]